MKQIILASSSPRRKELLANHHISFKIDYADIEEYLDEQLSIPKRLEKLAYDKGVTIAKKYPEAIVISADTMVCLFDQMIGKPKDRQDAKAMLTSFSGNTQVAYTAIAIFENDKVTTYCDATNVHFKTLTEEMIESYLDTDEWIGKAGAYGIQGQAEQFIDYIEGDKETVIGLPVRIIEEYIKNM